MRADSLTCSRGDRRRVRSRHLVRSFPCSEMNPRRSFHAMEEFLKKWDASADAIEARIEAARASQAHFLKTKAQFDEAKELVDVEQAKPVPSVDADDFVTQHKRIGAIFRRMTELSSQFSEHIATRAQIATDIVSLQCDVGLWAAKSFGKQLKPDHASALQQRLARAEALSAQAIALMK